MIVAEVGTKKSWRVSFRRAKIASSYRPRGRLWQYMHTAEVLLVYVCVCAIVRLRKVEVNAILLPLLCSLAREAQETA